ncbi:MAG: sialidase family protein, partial [Terriglobales bacterium]
MLAASRRTLCALVCLTAALTLSARAQFTLEQISVDKFTNADSDHRTEVEPDSFAWGNTIVATYHVARRPRTIGWGSADIGFSTSTDGGKTGIYGYLPGLTVNYKNGTYYGAADPTVAYDAKHGVWLISSLALINPIGDVVVSRSADGIHWGSPILIDGTHNDDKNWTVCDNTSTSPYYGNCYTEWDAAASTGLILMSTSSDGGKTWSAGKATADQTGGLGGEPLVQPNGTVVVPFSESYAGVGAFRSTNGGASWTASVLIAVVDSHSEGGGLRSLPLPSAEIDATGKVYVVWQDCRFRTGCAENDIVMSTSSDGKTWTTPARIPIDPTNSTVDHFIPGIGVDPTTSGATAHLTLVYYYYPVSNCNSNCQLEVGFVTSQDGGSDWTGGVQLAGPMELTWLPVSDLGPMVADYISVSYMNGNPFGVFAVAKAPSGSLLNEAMYTTKQPLLAAADAPRFSSRGELPVPNAKS